MKINNALILSLSSPCSPRTSSIWFSLFATVSCHAFLDSELHMKVTIIILSRRHLLFCLMKWILFPSTFCFWIVSCLMLRLPFFLSSLHHFRSDFGFGFSFLYANTDFYLFFFQCLFSCFISFLIALNPHLGWDPWKWLKWLVF